MKVLLLNGSSHPNGTTMAAIKEMEKVFLIVKTKVKPNLKKTNLFVEYVFQNKLMI